MSASKLLFSLLGSIAAMAFGAFLAERFAEPMTSVWLAAMLGLVFSLAINVATGPILRRAVTEGYLPDRDERSTVWGRVANIFFALLIGFFLIVLPEDQVVRNQDYFLPYLGGFLIGQIVISLFEGTRLKAKTQ